MIVGFTGYATSGKDTAALALIHNGYERRAFADPLRNCLLTLDPIVSAFPDEAILKQQRADGVTEMTPGYGVQYLRLSQAVDAVGWDEAKKLGEIRRLLQVFGTEVVRDNFGRDAWVNILRDSMRPGIDYVITDVRFPNEVEMIYRAGGIVVRIDRPGVGPVNAHVSDDIAYLYVDFIIDNDGTVEELHQRVRDLI